MTQKYIFPIPYTKNANINLFCFPCAGSSASMYANWIKFMPAHINIIPVEYPGHGARIRENLTSNVNQIATEIADHILKLDDKPFAFFGHSIGVPIIWRVIKILDDKKQLERLLLLALSGRPENSFLPNEKNIHLLDDEQFLKIVKR